MRHVFVLAGLALLLSSHDAPAQSRRVLHITVTLQSADRQPLPVPRHALLVSDEPPSDAPRRVFTGLDGTVAIRVRPGRYVVESDRPVALDGRSYQWAVTVDVPADRDATLELTAGNAEVEQAPPDAAEPAVAPESDPTFLLPRWQDSVVAIWTPAARTSGFVADARGLVVTTHDAIGDATPVAVQVSASVKVPARVLESGVTRGVAVLWIDPAAATSVKPVPVECPPAAASPVAEQQEVFTIGVALRGPRDLVVGTASVRKSEVTADFNLEAGSDGGPVFTAAGRVVGVTSLAGEEDESGRGDVRVLGLGSVCEALAAATRKMTGAEAPVGTRLPVEPSRPLATATLEEAAPRRLGPLGPYRVSASDFDVTFITPLVAYAAQRRLDEERTGGGVSPEVAWERERLLTDFGAWAEYFRDVRPVLVVRVTPKLTEGFWAKVARGAASTQGVQLPPIKRRKPGFARMRLLCGGAEAAPIHPFAIDVRAPEGDGIREGLYVYGPDALGPHCGTVSLVLWSEKEPDRGDTHVVDPKVVERVWQDFAPHRLP